VVFLRGFSFSNYNAERRQQLNSDFKSLAKVKLGIATGLFFINPFLGLWVGMAGLMLVGLAGGVRLSDAVLRSNFRRVNSVKLRVKVFRQARTNRARAYRRGASRTVADRGSGDADGDDGGSDSDSGGDPPDCNTYPLLVAPFPIFLQKKNHSFSWHVLCGLGCWRLLRHVCSVKEESA